MSVNCRIQPTDINSNHLVEIVSVTQKCFSCMSPHIHNVITLGSHKLPHFFVSGTAEPTDPFISVRVKHWDLLLVDTTDTATSQENDKGPLICPYYFPTFLLTVFCTTKLYIVHSCGCDDRGSNAFMQRSVFDGMFICDTCVFQDQCYNSLTCLKEFPTWFLRLFICENSCSVCGQTEKELASSNTIMSMFKFVLVRQSHRVRG